MHRIISLSFVELPAVECDGSHAITLILRQYRSDGKTGGIGRHLIIQIGIWNYQQGRRRQSIFQSLKSFRALFSPFKKSVLLEHVRKWHGKFAK